MTRQTSSTGSSMNTDLLQPMVPIDEFMKAALSDLCSAGSIGECLYSQASLPSCLCICGRCEDRPEIPKPTCTEARTGQQPLPLTPEVQQQNRGREVGPLYCLPVWILRSFMAAEQRMCAAHGKTLHCSPRATSPFVCWLALECCNSYHGCRG